MDRNFRQPGLEGNEAKVGGVTRVKYYGELLDPELSNLSVFTVALGLRPTRDTSLDLVFHHYRQPEAAARFRGADIDADPTGRSGRLGHEIDLVFGLRDWGNFEAKAVGGYFIPGPAFRPSADGAFLAALEMEYEF